MDIILKPYITRRIIAGFIDYSCMFFISVILIVNFGTYKGDGNYELTGFPALIINLFWLLFIVGMEQITGATLGNGITGLKPTTLSGSKPSFIQSFKRHLLDPIDMFFFGLVGIITIKNSEKSQRLGDSWAKTIVIRDKK